MKILIIVAFSIGIFLLSSTAIAQFYYGSHGPVPLKVDSSRVLIKFDQFMPSSPQDIMASIHRIVGEIPDSHLIDDFVACTLSTGLGYNQFIDSLHTVNGIYLAEPYYRNASDSPMVVGEEFAVLFDSTIARPHIDSVCSHYRVVINRESRWQHNMFVIKNTDSSGMRVLDLANIFHEMEEISISHPNFSIPFVPFGYTLYDHYNSFQPHIKKVIGRFNNVSVWDFSGLTRRIRVAVIDCGVEQHEDLPQDRVLPGYNFVQDVPDGSPEHNELHDMAHGMDCAGIIAASHTTDSIGGSALSSGMISLNPHVEILPVKIFSDYKFSISPFGIHDAILYAGDSNADILSNSWGSIYTNIDLPTVDTALGLAFAIGRHGRGCPIIFASGNLAQSYPDSIAYPANQWYCFSVGAIHLNDSIWDYSQYGQGLKLVAPSGYGCNDPEAVWSLDQMSVYGSNPFDTICSPSFIWDCPSVEQNNINYDCHFGGTSAACPIVAGVASLILAKRPDLNVLQVYEVLERSAVTDLDWGHVTVPSTKYGYGRVDAFRAILALSRGDVNNDNLINVGDAVYMVNFINFGPAPVPDTRVGDANCDGHVNVGDVVFLVNYVFKGGPAPGICYRYNY
jgi:subtilisin family serine protease